MSSFGPDHTCVVDGCERKAPRTSMCDMHRKRMSRHGDPGSPVPFAASVDPCRIPGCGKNARTKGMCSVHYMRVYNRGLACPAIGAFDDRSKRVGVYKSSRWEELT